MEIRPQTDVLESTSEREERLFHPSHEWTFSRPRLRGIREMFQHSPISDLQLELLMDDYAEWVHCSEFLLLHGKSSRGETRNVAVKCSKRGNDVHAKRLEQKLGFLNRKELRNVRFFELKDLVVGKKVTTRMLWITLTTNPSLGSRRELWERSSHDVANFLENLEAEYGEIEDLWFPQAFPDRKGAAWGDPHNHMVVLFKKAEFNVFASRRVADDGEDSWVFRISEKRALERAGKHHSFIDVEAISSVPGAVSYCRKYAQNVLQGESEAAILTNSLLWLFGKHSYGMSHHFREQLHDLIALCKFSYGQRDLMGNLVPEWEWHAYGVWTPDELGIHGESWTSSVSDDVWRRLKVQLEHRAS